MNSRCFCYYIPRAQRWAPILGLVVLLLSQQQAAAQFWPFGKNQSDKKQEEETQVVNTSDRRKGESLFIDGCKYYLLDEYEKAQSKLEKALDYLPEDAAVHYKLAQTKLKMEQYNDALLYAEDALFYNKDIAHYYRFLASLYERMNRYDDARETYQKLLSHPEAEARPEDYKQLAQYQVEAGNPEKALKTLNRLESDFGPNRKLLARKQELYMETGQSDKALKEAREMSKAHPENGQLRLNVVDLLISSGQYEKAAQELEKVLDNNPTHSRARMALGEIRNYQGQPDKAMEQFERAFDDPSIPLKNKLQIVVRMMSKAGATSPEEEAQLMTLAKSAANAHPESAEAQVILGDLYNQNDQLEEARQQFLKASKLSSSNFDVWREILVIDSKLEQTDSLVKHSEEASQLFPNQPVIWLFNGSAHMRNESYAEAVQALEQGSLLAQNEPSMQSQFQTQLGNSYYHLGKYEKAWKAYEKALKITPNDPHVLNNFAYYLSLEKQNLEHALELSARLIERHPDDPTYQDTRGWVLYQSGDFEHALKLLRQAAEGSSSGEVLEHYGDALYQTGQIEKAITYWKKARDAGDGVSDNIDQKIAEKKLFE